MPSLKVLHLSYSDDSGGAGRAAYRIHVALRDMGVSSFMWVNKSSTGDWTVTERSNFQKFINIIRNQVAKKIVNFFLKTESSSIHSMQILPSNWVNKINASEADIVHIHWVQAEMLSISDLARINKPLVWTLHDMWAFCGAEHTAQDCRWRDGYESFNRPTHETGFDINRWTWKRKKKYWRLPIQVVVPSGWLGSCVSDSKLMKNWPVTIIPNPINIRDWAPIDKHMSRQLLGLPSEVPLLLFGALGGGSDRNKGFDLLSEALKYLSNEISGLELVVLGQRAPRNLPKLGYPIHYLGHLSDNLSLRIAYSAADVLVVPSRVEAFGQTASEAHACGVPVVGFNNSGLTEIVSHKKTGYLAQAFDTKDMAVGIEWVLNNAHTLGLRLQSRNEAVAKFSSSSIAAQYKRIYSKVLSRKV